MKEEQLKKETHSILCPHCKKVFRIDDVAKMYIEEGKLASQEKCLKMIEEVYEDEPVYVQEVEKIINRIFDKITKKIKEMKG